MAAKSFKATLERGGGALNWTIARIPFDSAKIWGSRGHIRVKGDINGFPIRTNLFPTGEGGHVMLVNKTMQTGARIKLGDTARFRIEPDSEHRAVEIPPQLEAILQEDRALRRWFQKLTGSTQNWISKWIADVKSDEARTRRAEQMAERMINTMEAEQELPPALKIAFANDPIAYEQWKRISPSQRRGNLLGVFAYRDPQSRTRRIRRMLDDLRGRGLK